MLTFDDRNAVLTAIRDAETRVMFSGYNPLWYKLAAWTLSALLCALTLQPWQTGRSL